MTDQPVFYPEETLQRHGLTAREATHPGCYALKLNTPDVDTFRDRWHSEYDVEPPEALNDVIASHQDLFYVGCAGNLQRRLSDHVQGDKRQVTLFNICPIQRLHAVWRYPDVGEAATHETLHAYDLRDVTGAAVWCNGSVIA